MLRLMWVAAGAAASTFLTTTALAEPLQPTGHWVVDYRLEQCLASREYGASSKPVTFGIRPPPNADTYLLLLAQKRPGPDFGIEEEASVDFGNGPIRSWLLEYRDRPSGSDIYQFRISAAEMNQARVASSVKLRPSGGPT